MSNESLVQKYIDSVDGRAHMSAVAIISELVAKLAAAEKERDRLRISSLEWTAMQNKLADAGYVLAALVALKRIKERIESGTPGCLELQSAYDAEKETAWDAAKAIVDAAKKDEEHE